MTPYSKVVPEDFGLRKGRQPVRAIRPRTGRLTMPGRFPTKKGTLKSLRGESNLEMDGFAQFEVNPRCVLMAAQPHTLHFIAPTAKGGTRAATYVPDLAIRMDDGRIAVVDFKVAKHARLPRWRARAELLRQLYEKQGAVFSVVTDEAIKIEPRATNVRIMLARRPWHPDDEADAAVDAAIAAVGLPATVATLRARAALSQPHPHADRAFSRLVELAIQGKVRFDLGRRLDADSVVHPAAAGVRP